MPLRAAGRVEGIGLDVTDHGEEAYTGGDGAILMPPRGAMPATAIETAGLREGVRS